MAKSYVTIYTGANVIVMQKGVKFNQMGLVFGFDLQQQQQQQ